MSNVTKLHKKATPKVVKMPNELYLIKVKGGAVAVDWDDLAKIMLKAG